MPKNTDTYVLFGFNKKKPNETGYLSEDCVRVVQDLAEARRFTRNNIHNIKGFGSPEKWMDFFNSEKELGFKFHLVKVIK